MPRRRPNPLVRLAISSALALAALLFATPLLWMAATAIRPADQTLDPKVGLLPRMESPDHRTLSPVSPGYWSGVAGAASDNLRAVLSSPTADFPLYIQNSLRVALLSVVGMVLSSSIVAYGLARLRWRGRTAVFILVLATMMMPFTVIMAPQYLLFRNLGWIGTFRPLWVPAWFGGAFSIFLLRQFFLGIPRELDEAARIDGCGHWRTFWLIILPLSKPALAVVALFQFLGSWNDFAGPLVFLNHERMYTVALGLQMYQNQHGGVPWNLVMTASLVATIPVLVVFLLAQRSIVEGVATQGLKD
ncbi:MAG: carbohydrate ABC transporter permease [Phycisphaerales bacterium]|nr:carbohydrate ABC transporter permease [Phycisphaerales bacterium]